MQPQKPPAALRKRLFFFIIFLASVCLMTGMFALSVAQSTEERELEDKIPKHLPIKIKIKKEKEKAFKDLKNEKWLRDFELEVTNTGDKPIYFLDLTVVLPEITAPNGYTVMFGLHYGRIALGDIKTKAEPDDVPIKPGETYVFSLTHKQEAWEVFRSKRNWQQPKKLRVKFQIMSFGDGTGFWGNEGMAVPRDTIFSSLRLWQDANHNGVSEAGELQGLEQRGVATLELDYRESKRVDQSGNQFRYRAKVRDAHGSQVGRWAWDVFLRFLTP